MRLKVGDEVKVIAGAYKGETGEIQRILHKKNRVVVTGINMVKKHQKPRQSQSGSPIQGGIIEFEAPIAVSNVMLMDDGGEPTRVGVRRDEDGRRVRFSKRTGNDID